MLRTRKRKRNVVRRKDGCWEFIGTRTGFGYGQFNLNGVPYLAHRYIWMKLHGNIPTGMEIMHTCDHPWCVNVEHLVMGTHAENMRDRNVKHRQARGETHGRSKLTKNRVFEIRSRRGRGETLLSIGGDLGVHISTVSLAARGLTWKHVTW